MNRGATIVSYVAELERVLTGPHGLKKDLLAEARGSLEDAAETYRAEGAAPSAAERLAIQDFGTTEEVAPAYQRELAMAQSVRTAWWLLVFVAAQFIQAKMSWKSTGAWQGHRPSDGYLLFSHVWSWSQILIVVIAAVGAVSFGIGVRYIRMPWRLTPVIGAFTLLVLGVKLIVSAIYFIATPHLVAGIVRQATTMPDLVFALLVLLGVWMLPNCYIALSAIRCVTSAHKCGSALAVA